MSEKVSAYSSGRRHMAERSLDHLKTEGGLFVNSAYTLSLSLPIIYVDFPGCSRQSTTQSKLKLQISIEYPPTHSQCSAQHHGARACMPQNFYNSNPRVSPAQYTSTVPPDQHSNPESTMANHSLAPTPPARGTSRSCRKSAGNTAKHLKESGARTRFSCL